MTRLLAIALLLMLPAGANAAVAGRGTNEGSGIVFSAALGEKNDVTVTRDGDGYLIEDPGVFITSGEGCEHVEQHRIRCSDGASGLSVNLGDGDDRAAMADDLPGSVYLYGEQGADELVGSAAAGGLVGGPGSDILRGGSGTSLIQGIERIGWETGARPANTLLDPDTITCTPRPPGVPGFAVVEADSADNVDPACANVQRGPDPGPDPTPSKRKGKCKTSSRSAGAKIVARSKDGVIFSKRLRYYGCLYSTGRIASLHDEGGGIRLTGGAKPVFNGRYVAYASYGSAIGDEFDRVVVWDLRGGYVQYLAFSTNVRELVLKKNGSVAWTAPSIVTSFSTRPYYEVHQISRDDRQGDLLLDRGTDLDPKTLRLLKDKLTLSWVRFGKRQTAPLR